MRIIACKTPSRVIDIAASLAASYPRSLKDRIYVFCESRATLSFERKISALIGGAFSVSVSGFSRYVYLNAGKTEYLSKAASSIAVRRITGEKAGELTRFRNADYRLAPIAYELISQLKSAKVAPSDLDRIVEGEGGAFGGKLNDIRVIYGAYEDYVKQNGLVDEGSYLSLMPALIAADEKLKGARVIIAGVSSLTKQTIDIITALEKFCRVDYVLLKGNPCVYTNETYYKLLSLFPNATVEEDGKYPVNEARAIENGLFNPAAKEGEGGKTERISVYEVATPKEEMELVAKKIRKAVVENGKRYKDFRIAVNDPASYESVARSVFSSLGIPLYADVKKPLSAHPAARLFMNIIKLKKQGFLPEILVETVKNPLCAPEYGDEFEDYVLKNAVSRKTVRKPFEGEIEKIRARVVDGVSSLKLKGTIREYVDEIIALYEDFCVKERAKELKEKLLALGETALAEFCESGLKAFYRLLEEAAETGGDVKLGFSEFGDMLAAGIVADEISLLPQRDDCVFMGDFSSVRQSVADCLFVCGATADVPSYKTDSSLLSDRELIKMDGYRCVVEPKLKLVNERERENVVTTLMSFKEELVVTLPRTDFSGAPIKSGQITEDITKIFSDENGRLQVRDMAAERAAGLASTYSVDDYSSLEYGAESLVKELSAVNDGKLSSESPYAVAFSELLRERDGGKYQTVEKYAFKKADGLTQPALSYGDRLSATAIERYFACPYLGFVENRLKLKTRETGDCESYELGNLLHSALERFAPMAAKTDRGRVKEVADRLFDEQLKESGYEKYLGKSRYACIFDLVREETEKRCLAVKDELEGGAFKVHGAEVVFSDGGNAEYPPLKLDTPYGVSLLRGKIDRVDVFEDDSFGEKTDWARVIDYKTGSVDKKITEEALYTGRSLQLYLYARVLKEAGYKTAGAYYYKMDESFSQKGEDGSGFFGKGVKNLVVMRGMDASVPEVGGESKLFSFKTGVDKDTGEIVVKSGKGVMEESELSAYAAYAKRVAESAATEMKRGCVIPSPYDDACASCKYKGMCRYDLETGERTRKVGSVDPQTIIMNAGDEDE